VTPKDPETVQHVVRETKELITMLERTSVRRLCLDAGGFKIEIERESAQHGPAATVLVPADSGASPPKDKHARIVAPLVGTFYQSATPGAKPFAEVGGRVQRGQVVCIIEAMKIMNEVQSDVTGTVLEILVSNGQAVQFDQPLMVIDTSS